MINLMVCIVIALMVGCAQKPKSASSSEAIQKASAMETVEAKTEYLIKEANAFVNSQKFDEAIATAKHVLSKLDAESQEAKNILEKAKAELEKIAKEKAGEMKGELNKKLGDIGQ